MNTEEQIRPSDNSASRNRLRWLAAGAVVTTVLLLMPGMESPALAAQQQPTFAVVETDKELGPLADLLTAQLSQEGVQLVERKQLDAILQEQELSAAGLTDRANLVKVGQLVRADAFVLLSLEKGQEGSALRVRVAETAHGVRLLDMLEPWDPKTADATATSLQGRLKGLVAKLELPRGQVIALGMLDVRNALPPADDNKDAWMLSGLKATIAGRMGADPRVIVLERDDLDILMQEKDLTAGEHGAFWGSAVLVQGALTRPYPGDRLILEVQLVASGDRVRGTTSAQVSPQDPARAAQDAAEKLLPFLTHAVAAGTWEPKEEAARYYHLAWAVQDPKEKLSDLNAAHALDPQNVTYWLAIHHCLFGQALDAGDLQKAGTELSVLEGYVDGRIAADDVEALLGWQLLLGPLTLSDFRYEDILEIEGRCYRLAERVKAALGKHKDDPRAARWIAQMNQREAAMLDYFRTPFSRLTRERDALLKAGRTADAEPIQRLMDRYVKEFPQLAVGPARANLHVRMLLTAAEWPLPWRWTPEGDGWFYARLQWKDGTIWMAVSDLRGGRGQRVVGLVGLKPDGKGPVALWQAVASSSMSGGNRLLGMVLDEKYTYVAVRDMGIWVFPGTAVGGQGVLTEPRVLSEKDGLPVSHVTCIGSGPGGILVGFGGGTGQSGMGLYNPSAGTWKTLFSLPDLNPGTPRYTVEEIVPCADAPVFAGSVNRSGVASLGLWQLDERSGQLEMVGSYGRCYICTGMDGEYELHGGGSLLTIEPARKKVQLGVYSKGFGAFRLKASDWTVEPGTFAPPVEGQQPFGGHSYGAIDLVTGAIHGDQLWAHYGKTQLIIVQRGQKVQDGKRIENSILDGGPVLQFFDTPYGLLALGQGSVGIVETEGQP